MCARRSFAALSGAANAKCSKIKKRRKQNQASNIVALYAVLSQLQFEKKTLKMESFAGDAVRGKWKRLNDSLAKGVINHKIPTKDVTL